MKTSYELWWESLYSPTHLIESILEKIQAKESVILSFTNKLPWISYFKSVLYNKIQDETNILIDALDELNPDKTLLETLFIIEGIGSKYKSERVSIKEGSLLDSQLDKTKVYLIDIGESKTRMDELLQLIQFFNSKKALFFVLYQGSLDDSDMHILHYEDYITHFDELNLLKIINRNPSYNETMNHYLSELAHRLYQDDLEEAVSFLEKHKIGDSLLDDKPSNQKAIWEAELQIYYPLIENIKQKFLEKYRQELEKLIPYTDQYRNTYSRIEEFELAQLRIFFLDGSITPLGKDLDKIQFIYEFRNKLAHMKMVDEASLLDKRLYEEMI